MTNLDSIFKSRDITLPTKVHLVKSMVFPVVMYGCKSWTVKKAECRRCDAFELWCWRRLLRVPWTARRSNHSILKEISPGCSLEGLMLKQKLQYFGQLMRRVDSLKRSWCWERLKVRKKGDNRGWLLRMLGLHHWLNGHEFGWTPRVGDGQAWRPVIHRVAKSQTRLSDWTKHQISLITANHNKCKNNKNVWNIERITKILHRDTIWANDAWKMTHRLLQYHRPSICKKKKKKRKKERNSKKKQYLWSKIKWSTIKWGMPKNINIALLNYPEKQNSFHETNKRILQCW